MRSTSTPSKEVGRITGFTSPRYIHFLSDEKAYVTQIWDPRIYIVNPKTYQITGYVETDMISKPVRLNRWCNTTNTSSPTAGRTRTESLVIDTETDKVCDQITVGIQPTSLVMDKYNKIWTVTDGGYEGSPYGHEAPSLYCIDAATRKIEKQFKFKFGDWPSEVQLNGTRDTLYFINKAVWRLPVTADKFPVKPFASLQQYALLRTDDQPCQFGSLYRRRDRLRAERCRTALFARRRTARRILCRDHPRRLLLALII